MIRKVIVGSGMFIVCGAIAGTAFSQVSTTATVPAGKPVKMDPALALDLRVARLETEIATLKQRVQTLCDTVSTHSNQLHDLEGPDTSGSVTMKPPKAIVGSCG